MIQLTEGKLCYRLIEGQNIDQWLEGLDFKVISRSTEEFFDTKDGAYYKRGIFIKLKNSHILEISANPTCQPATGGTTDTIRDYRFPVPFDPDKMGSFNELEIFIGLKRPRPFLFSHFLSCNSLRSFVTLDKTRKTYKTETTPLITITIDQFSELGTFIEFTAINSSLPYPTETFTADVHKVVKNLPLIPFNDSLVELALRETDAELYMQKQLVISA